MRTLGNGISAALVAAGLLLVPAAASAQAWPAKPVRVVNPFPAGGGLDIVTRALAATLGDQLGQQFVVENRTGAGGNIGSEVVAKSAPDGYTLLMGSDHLTISKPLYPNLSYDPMRDLVPVSLLNMGPHVLVAHPSFEANSVKELIDMAKKAPGKHDFASAGNGTAQHLAGEMLKRMAGIDLVHIPYKGGAPAIQDLMGGQVKLGVIGMPPIVGHIQGGRLKALAVTSPRRSSVLPDVPTVAETVPGFQSVQWFGVLVPAGTPAPIVDRLSAELRKAVGHAQMKAIFAKIGSEVVGSTPGEFAKFMQEDLERWSKVIREAGVKVD
jgi:tripartite-type tricarboxylate transporter receptor subunit TctC